MSILSNYLALVASDNEAKKQAKLAEEYRKMAITEAQFASYLFHTYGLGLEDIEVAADVKYMNSEQWSDDDIKKLKARQKEIDAKIAAILMTRKEAIAKCHGIAYPEAFVQALEALGLLKIDSERLVMDIVNKEPIIIKRHGKIIYED